MRFTPLSGYPQLIVNTDTSPGQIITPERFDDSGSHISRIEIPAHVSQNYIGPQTFMCLIRPDSLGQNNLGYVYITGDKLAGNIRVFVSLNGTGRAITFGAGTTGVQSSPFRTTTVDVNQYAYGDSVLFASTWDGGLTGAGINNYIGTNGSPLALVNSTTLNNGTGATLLTTGQKTYIGQRDDLIRGFDGDIFWICRWNRVLTTYETNMVRMKGPTSVPDGIFFLYVNGQEISINRLGPMTKVEIGKGSLSQYCPIFELYNNLTYYNNLFDFGTVASRRPRSFSYIFM